MSRLDKINSLLIKELADLATKEVFLDNGLITISYVKCSADLRQAKIGVSVLPDNLAGTALRKLKKHNAMFSGYLKKKLNLKHIPKFNWIIDGREKHAAEIEKVLEQIKNNE